MRHWTGNTDETGGDLVGKVICFVRVVTARQMVSLGAVWRAKEKENMFAIWI